jgi:uncharacterized protein with von Willebrand factor type A (vWA) domain
MSSPSDIDQVLVGFGTELRRAGIPVGTDDVLTFCEGVTLLSVTDLLDIYWAGRASFVHKREHIATYNLVFREYFLGEDLKAPDDFRRTLRSSSNAGASLDIPNTEEGLPGDISPDEIRLGYVASASEVYRHKAFADCSDDELRQMRRLISRMRITPPKRRTHRMSRARRRGQLDMRRMVRDSMRTLGETGQLAYRRRKEKLRPLVLILDVSGSMADYSRNLLQFAYAARRANAKVDVYCFGTRLTRITRSLDRRDPDDAMRIAGEAVFDWDGGTRIGDSLADFTHRARRSGLGRGSIVVICSDGLDRGEPQALAEAMEGLSRIAHRVIWVNPHRGDAPVYVPASLGMIIADPYIDEVHSGHNLASLERLANRLSKVG